MTTRNRSKKALSLTIKKMVPAVLIAVISTALGLLSLYRSQVPMIQDFGSMLTIGIIIAFIIALFIFLPILYVRDSHFSGEKQHMKQSKARKHKDNKIIHYLIGIIIKGKYIIISVAVILAILGIFVDQNAEAETNLENFMPQDSEALSDIRTLRETLGSTEQLAIVFEGDNLISDGSLELIAEVQSYLNEHFDYYIIESSSIITLMKQITLDNEVQFTEEQIVKIPENQRKLFINDNYTKSVISISIVSLSDESFEEFLIQVNSYLNTKEGFISITVTGQAIIDAELMRALTTGRYEITIIGLILIFISLLVIYKSFYRAVLPLIPIILIVGWSGGVMAIFGIDYTPLTATLGALIMGIGTEFTILITERYEEEKLRVEDKNIAIKVALSKMSNPIFVSALTTMGGFSALIFSDFVILSNFGIMTVVNLSLALLSTIIVLPAILAVAFKPTIKVVENAYSTS